MDISTETVEIGEWEDWIVSQFPEGPMVKMIEHRDPL